jgi:hypothetical protein
MAAILAFNGVISAIALMRTADEATLHLIARSGSCFVLAALLLFFAGITRRRLQKLSR